MVNGMASILVLHGPNLNLLGTREPHHYGANTLEAINEHVAAIASNAGHTLTAKQSNAEYELIEWIQSAAVDGVDFIVINPAAYTHTSVALRDAMIASEIPFVEVHLSNVYKREGFRQRSYFSDISVGVICGLGAQGYEFGVQAAISYLQNQTNR